MNLANFTVIEHWYFRTAFQFFHDAGHLHGGVVRHVILLVGIFFFQSFQHQNRHLGRNPLLNMVQWDYAEIPSIPSCPTGATPHRLAGHVGLPCGVAHPMPRYPPPSFPTKKNL